MNYVLHYENFKHKTLTDLVDELDSCTKIVIREIKLIDLVFDQNSAVGIYLFFDDDTQIAYIGVSTSRQLLERIAGHFDLRVRAFMNHFLKALVIKQTGKTKEEISDQDIANAFKTTHGYSIAFLAINDGTKAKKLERILQSVMQPYLNRTKKKKKYSAGSTLEHLLV